MPQFSIGLPPCASCPLILAQRRTFSSSGVAPGGRSASAIRRRSDDEAIAFELVRDLERSLVVGFDLIVIRSTTIRGTEVMEIEMLGIAPHVDARICDGLARFVHHPANEPLGRVQLERQTRRFRADCVRADRCVT